MGRRRRHTGRSPAGLGDPIRLDVLGYTVAACSAFGLAVVTAYHGHRVWGVCAGIGYLLAALVGGVSWYRGGANQGRFVALSVATVAAIPIPLAVLVAHRSAGVAWSAQPEVGVVERAAVALLGDGTPYSPLPVVGADFDDYVPYHPAMAVFGIPRALGGAPVGLPAHDPPPADAWTDPRLWFAAVGGALLLVAVLILRRAGAPTGSVCGQRFVVATQLVVAAPPTALAVSTGGDDIPVLGALVLAVVLLHVGRPTGAGLVAGAALALKLSALPVAVVLVATIAARHGPRAAARSAAAGLAPPLVTMVPVLAVRPGAFVDHVVRYPAGLTDIDSPARSPLPGHLIAETGPVGTVVALTLLGCAALALTVALVRRTPADAAEAATFAAVGMATATALLPSTRFGYLVYPLVLYGTAILLRTADVRTSPTASLPRVPAASHRLRTALGAQIRTSGRSTPPTNGYSPPSRTSS